MTIILPLEIKNIIRDKYFGSVYYWKNKFKHVLNDISRANPYSFLDIYPGFSDLKEPHWIHVLIRARKRIMEEWDNKIIGWTKQWKKARK
jgi:hypothetical protein